MCGILTDLRRWTAAALVGLVAVGGGLSCDFFPFPIPVPVPDGGNGGDSGTVCGGIAGILCQQGQYCKFQEGDCSSIADAQGVCTAIPDACTQEFAPVCGCDGNTYGNECQAAQAGTSIDYQGPCLGG